ncbi:MAG: hypothetical protein KKA73_17010 [Chloroflexi bacterium]|nr:hypothetical protein [Chloroflexota bacterium]MBU1749388.1 hypothetical protein [Chloroflexota bacterium]
MNNGYGFPERLVRIGVSLVVIILILVILAALVASQNSKYLTDSRLLSRLVEQALIYALVAGGVGLTLAAGEVDLSVGGVASLAAIVMAGLVVNNDVPAVIALVVALGLGLLIGLINGVLIAGLRLPFYIITPIMWALTLGLSYVLADTRGMSLRSPAFEGSLALLLVINLLVYGLGVLALLLLGRFTSLGKLTSLNARSEAEGRPGNLPLGLYKVGAYAISGLLAAGAGVALLNLYRTALPASYSDLTTVAIAAAVVGGVPLWKGSTRLLGALLGALALALSSQLSNLLQMQAGLRLTSTMVWALLALLAVILWGAAGWVLDLVFGRKKLESE